MKKLFLATLLCLNTACYGYDEYSYKIIKNDIYDLHISKTKKGILPDDLIIPPDVYSYDGKTYDMFEEGLYRIAEIGTPLIQRIVFYNDIDILMCSIAWLHIHGYRDNAKSFGAIQAIAKKEKIQLICGNMCMFTQKLLNMLGIENRLVVFLTLNEWNDYSNGHTMIEIKDQGQWKLWDIDLKHKFVSDGKHLSAREAIDLLAKQQCDIIDFCPADKLAHESLSIGNANIFLEKCIGTENAKKRWYQNIADVLIIEYQGNFYFTCEDIHKERLLKYPYFKINYLQKKEFETLFYHKDINI